MEEVEGQMAVRMALSRSRLNKVSERNDSITMSAPRFSEG